MRSKRKHEQVSGCKTCRDSSRNIAIHDYVIVMSLANGNTKNTDYSF